MNKEKIKTVFLDLDDTLWWFTENSKVSLRYIYDKYHLADYCADYGRFADMYHEKNNELWELYHYGKIEKEYLVTERYRYVLERIGYKGDREQLGSELNDAYLSYLAQQPKLIPGARDLLEYLAGKYDVNVLSNGFKGVQKQKLLSGGIAGFIHHLILSDDVGITKPLPGIFEYALAKSGADAESAVMIGDNYDADIRGAKDVGWHTIFFNWKNNREGDVDAADFVVEELQSIKGIL